MGKIIGNDCCSSDWKNIVKQLWAKYQNVVKSIRVDQRNYYPDGDGQIRMDGILTGMSIVGYIGFYSLTVADDIPTANLKDMTNYFQLTIGV